MKKILFTEGPEAIRTDEGDIKRGVPFDASGELAAKLLDPNNETYKDCYKFTEVEMDSRLRGNDGKKKKKEDKGEEEK